MSGFPARVASAYETKRVARSKYVGDSNYALVKVRGQIFVAVHTEVGVPPGRWGAFEVRNLAGLIPLHPAARGETAIGNAVHEWLHLRLPRQREEYILELEQEVLDAIRGKSRRQALAAVKRVFAVDNGRRKLVDDARDLIAFLWSDGVRARAATNHTEG